MRPVVVSTAALFLVTVSTSCDRSPPTDPHRPLALRAEAARVPDASNFVAHPLSDLIAALSTAGAYANVHTNDGVAPTNTGPGDFPGGEIRGQIDVAGPTP